MVAVSGDGGCHGGAHHFGEVEFTLPRIASRNNNPAGGIGRSREKAALRLWKKARVLMKNRRKDSANKEILDRAIGRVRSVALAIAFGSLSVAGFAVFGLTDPGERTVPDNLHRIESSAGHNLKFLPGGERNDLAIRVDR